MSIGLVSVALRGMLSFFFFKAEAAFEVVRGLGGLEVCFRDKAVPAVHLVQIQGGPPPPKHKVWKAGRQYWEQVPPKGEHQSGAHNLLRLSLIHT